jgi:ribosomal protein S18 acetylase RimI-like enzyme
LGISKCHLFVFKDNEAGNKFWDKIGFTRRDDLFIYSKSI